jgi:hypothetical protein
LTELLKLIPSFSSDLLPETLKFFALLSEFELLTIEIDRVVDASLFSFSKSSDL